MMKLRIILADDHPIFRQGLRMLVDAQADMEVVGEAENGRTGVSLAENLKPDVVVMDVSIPDMNGLKAAEALERCCPGIKIVTLTPHADGGYLAQLLDAGATVTCSHRVTPTAFCKYPIDGRGCGFGILTIRWLDGCWRSHSLS
jgi:DNA-binding NarL/FixJ family response regulator